eukprot:scaffold7.g3430.t1
MVVWPCASAALRAQPGCSTSGTSGRVPPRRVGRGARQLARAPSGAPRPARRAQLPVSAVHADYQAKASDDAALRRPLKMELRPEEITRVFGYPRDLSDRRASCLSEFVAGLVDWSLLQNDKLWSYWVQLAWDRLDTNKDGYISLEELMAQLPIDDGSSDTGESRAPAAGLERMLEAKRMLREADVNGDGRISQAEFRELLLGTTLPDTLHQYDSRLNRLEALASTVVDEDLHSSYESVVLGSGEGGPLGQPPFVANPNNQQQMAGLRQAMAGLARRAASLASECRAASGLSASTSSASQLHAQRGLYEVNVANNAVDRALRELRNKLLDDGIYKRRLAEAETAKRLQKRKFGRQLAWIMRRKQKGF